MRKNDWLIIASGLAFSILFFQQDTGLNNFIFSIVVVSVILVTQPQLIKERNWLLAAAGVLISGVTAFFYGREFLVFINIQSIILLGGVSFKPQSSIIFAFVHSYLSFLSAIPRYIAQLISPIATSNSVGYQTQKGGRFGPTVLAILICFIFFLLYRAANPIFDAYAQKITFDFITVERVISVFMGIYIMNSLLHQIVIEFFHKKDIDGSNTLPQITLEQHLLSSWGRKISLPNEVFTGTILLALLNVLLLTANSLDFYHLVILQQLPAGITLSAFLHNGTNALIASIILAALTILFVFRGYLNFYEQSKWLKILCYLWIFQNILLITSVVYRNSIYIGEYGLTHKRIGVYYYLLFCSIGLITTAVKVYAKKSNWYLFRINSWVVYIVAITSTVFDWDSIITNYNIANFQKDRTMEIDEHYLNTLNHTNLPALYRYYVIERKNLKYHQQQEITRGSFDSFASSGGHVYTPDSMYYAVKKRYEHLKEEVAKADWQSYCITKHQSISAVDEMIKSQ